METSLCRWKKGGEETHCAPTYYRNSYTNCQLLLSCEVNHMTILPIQRAKISTKNLYIPNRRLRRICIIQTYRQSSKWSAVPTFWVTKCLHPANTLLYLPLTTKPLQEIIGKKKLLWWELQSLTSTGKYSKLVYTTNINTILYDGPETQQKLKNHDSLSVKDLKRCHQRAEMC